MIVCVCVQPHASMENLEMERRANDLAMLDVSSRVFLAVSRFYMMQDSFCKDSMWAPGWTGLAILI